MSLKPNSHKCKVKTVTRSLLKTLLCTVFHFWETPWYLCRATRKEWNWHQSCIILHFKCQKNYLHYSPGLTLATTVKQRLFFPFSDSTYKTSLITEDKTPELRLHPPSNNKLLIILSSCSFHTSGTQYRLRAFRFWALSNAVNSNKYLWWHILRNFQSQLLKASSKY